MFNKLLQKKDYFYKLTSLISFIFVFAFVFYFVIFFLIFISIINVPGLRQPGQVLGASELVLQAVITINEPDWVSNNNRRLPNLSLTKGYAPLPVFFQGWQDEAVVYEWNFGDEDSAYEQNPNTFSGPNAAHVYEEPGTYTVSLKVRDKNEVWSEAATTTIEVLTRDGTTYYIDTRSPNDTKYNGQCQWEDRNGDCGPFKTATKALGNLADGEYAAGDAILFKRGQTFKMDTQAIDGDWRAQSVLFGAYGLGDKPLIKYIGSKNDSWLTPGESWINVKFVDLIFDFESDDNQSQGLVYGHQRSKGWLFLRVEAKEPQNGFWHFSGSGGTTTDIFMIDSAVNQAKTYKTAGDQISATANINHLAIIHSQFDQAGESLADFNGVNQAVIADNIFSRPTFDGSALKITGSQNLGFDFPTKNIYIADNQFIGWIDPINYGVAGSEKGRYNKNLVQISPDQAQDTTMENVILARNAFINFEGSLKLANTSKATVKNNFFVTPVIYNNTGGITIGNSNHDFDTRPTTDTKILNNTIVYGLHNGNNRQNKIYTTAITINHYAGTSTPYGDEPGEIKAQNNIFYLDRRLEPKIVEVTKNDSTLFDDLDFKRNIYYVTNNFERGRYFQVDEFSYDLASWNIAFDQDSKSQFKDPKFMKVPNIPSHDLEEPISLAVGSSEIDEYISNLKLQSISPAIDRGAWLTDSIYYDFDKAVRHQGNKNDVGAFESEYSALE